MTQDQGNGYVDNSDSAPLNTQAYGFQKPAWQANAVLIGTVWVSVDTRPRYVYQTVAFTPAA